MNDSAIKFGSGLMDGQKLAQTGEGLGNGEVIRTAQRLEALGYDFVGVGEHLMRGDPPDPTDAGLVVLAAAAGATSRVRLHTSVLLTPLHHPVWLAKMANS